MGFFRSIASGLLNVASSGRNSTQLILIFQDNPGFARLALQQFERCVAERGLELTDQLIRDAEREVSKYPKLTMGEFLDGYVNRRMNDSLSRRQVRQDFESEPAWNYRSFEDWYEVFKRAAGQANSQLSVDADGGSMLDFMDHTPLKRAFRDKVEPKSLARDFAAQYDFPTFGRR